MPFGLFPIASEFFFCFEKLNFKSIKIFENRTDSKRERLVQRLVDLGVTVDIFGDCGEAPWTETWNDEDPKFAQYRYYLSLENSLCDDYVSEKLFRGLNLSVKFGLIPVALHGSINYASLNIPENSFIDANSMKIERLAHLLKNELPNDLKRLAKMFQWQSQFKLDQHFFEIKWENFCERLWLEQNIEQKVENVRETYGKCH